MSLCRLSVHPANSGDSDPGLLLWVRQMLFYKPPFRRTPPPLPVPLEPINSQAYFVSLEIPAQT